MEICNTRVKKQRSLFLSRTRSFLSKWKPSTHHILHTSLQLFQTPLYAFTTSNQLKLTETLLTTGNRRQCCVQVAKERKKSLLICSHCKNWQIGVFIFLHSFTSVDVALRNDSITKINKSVEAVVVVSFFFHPLKMLNKYHWKVQNIFPADFIGIKLLIQYINSQFSLAKIIFHLLFFFVARRMKQTFMTMMATARDWLMKAYKVSSVLVSGRYFPLLSH